MLHFLVMLEEGGKDRNHKDFPCSLHGPVAEVVVRKRAMSVLYLYCVNQKIITASLHLVQ